MNHSEAPNRRCAVSNGPSQKLATSRRYSRRYSPHWRCAVASGLDRKVTTLLLTIQEYSLFLRQTSWVCDRGVQRGMLRHSPRPAP